MLTPFAKNEDWNEEREELKLKFEAITDKYVMFEESDLSHISEKLRDKLAKTKEELRKIIAAL